VFTRSGVWRQQGKKLVGTGAVESSRKACPLRCPLTTTRHRERCCQRWGAASVSIRSGGHWTQDERLVGTGAAGTSAPSVAMSADGSIAMVGGSNDNGGVGAAWVFTRNGGGSDYNEALHSTSQPNSPSLTPFTPPIPPPNLDE
jgi:hypothetical protein